MINFQVFLINTTIIKDAWPARDLLRQMSLSVWNTKSFVFPSPGTNNMRIGSSTFIHSIAIPVTGFNRFIVLYTDKYIRQTIVNPLNGMWVRCRVRKRVGSGSFKPGTENRNCCYLNTQSPSLVQGWTRNGWIDLHYSFPFTNKITSTRLFRWQRNGHSIRWNF